LKAAPITLAAWDRCDVDVVLLLSRMMEVNLSLLLMMMMQSKLAARTIAGIEQLARERPY